MTILAFVKNGLLQGHTLPYNRFDNPLSEYHAKIPGIPPGIFQCVSHKVAITFSRFP